MIDFLKGTVGKDYFSDRLYGCQECIAEYLASKEPCPYDLQPQSQIQYAMGTNVSMRLEVSYAWVGWELELNGRLKELPSIPCTTAALQLEAHRIP